MTGWDVCGLWTIYQDFTWCVEIDTGKVVFMGEGCGVDKGGKVVVDGLFWLF